MQLQLDDFSALCGAIKGKGKGNTSSKDSGKDSESELPDLQRYDVELRALLSLAPAFQRQYRWYHQRCNYGLREHGKC
jgi:hypothetical protein